MLCTDINCAKIKEGGGCSVYPSEGQTFRDRMGYCPIPDDGPNKKVKTDTVKSRVGQQKQKKL